MSIFLFLTKTYHHQRYQKNHRTFHMAHPQVESLIYSYHPFTWPVRTQTTGPTQTHAKLGRNPTARPVFKVWGLLKPVHTKSKATTKLRINQKEMITLHIKVIIMAHNGSHTLTRSISFVPYKTNDHLHLLISVVNIPNDNPLDQWLASQRKMIPP